MEGEPVVSKAWSEDGIVHQTIEGTEVVLVRERKTLQVLIEGINYYTPQKNWSAIVYDLKTKEIVAVLGYDE